MPKCSFPAVPLLLLLAFVAPLQAQELAPVVVGREAVFQVASAGDTSAVLRARRIQDRLEERLATDEPLAPLRVERTDSAAALLLAGDILLRVTPRDAEVVLARPIRPGEIGPATAQVARTWAEALRPVFARLAAEERARVVLEGIPLFEVGGTPELRAARRAAAITLRISEYAAADPAQPLRVERVGRGAAVLAGTETLVDISSADAAARETTPVELAREWATQIERVAALVRQEQTWPAVLRIGIAVLAAILLAWALHRLLGRFARQMNAPQRPDEGLRGSIAAVIARWGIRLLQLILWVGLALLILWLLPRTRPIVYAAVDRALSTFARVAVWLFGPGLVVLLILVVTLLTARFVGAVVQHLVVSLGMRHGGRVALRAGTLSGTVAAAAQVLVLFVGVLTVLAQLDVDPVPLLASAGVAGIAIGFGVQSLIRDFFTGFFILLEDQYGVGDVIRVGAISGRVERLTLRITQIRSLDGSLTSIPNGEITTVTNLSKDYAQVVIDVPVALGEDVDRASEVIARTARELAAEWADRVRGEPEVLGVESVDPATRAMTIRVTMRTAPLEQWGVSRELRRRLVDAFEASGIEVPPRSALTFPDAAATGSPAP